jgi:hypothetical protein
MAAVLLAIENTPLTTPSNSKLFEASCSNHRRKTGMTDTAVNSYQRLLQLTPLSNRRNH